MDERQLTAESGGLEKEDPGTGAERGVPLPGGNGKIEAELAQIRGMDPEMTDLKAILSSRAGGEFRKYVGMGLSFLDAYTLAAREKLGELRDRRTAERIRGKAAGKDHLSATRTRGQGGVSVPAGEMAIIRAILPDATDEEIHRYYRQDKQRFGR